MRSSRHSVLFTVVVASALLCVSVALPMPVISSSYIGVCDCPTPDMCDKHSCPGGCYSSSNNACIPAPAGTYARLTNQSSSNVDVPCESGSFTSIAGATVCTACSAGRFAQYSGSTSCDACPAGSECPYAGMCLPFQCTAGSFSSSVGSISSLQFKRHSIFF
jgi:hypothetical protein